VALLTTLLLMVVFAVALAFRAPTHDRNWVEAAARISDAWVHDGVLTITNVRDWRYDTTGVTGKAWIDRVELPLSDVTRVWFLLEPFSAFPVIGHTMLSFEFSDGRVYAFSVEARREQGEDYSSFRGLFREYELKYAWGTEHDFISRRLFMLAHPLRMYPLQITTQDAQGILLALADATHELHETPRFYNTLSANCTNMLAKIINARYPGRLPYNFAWNMPGLSDRFLFKEGFIAGKDITTVRTAADLTEHKETLLAENKATASVFSTEVRYVLEPQP